MRSYFSNPLIYNENYIIVQTLYHRLVTQFSLIEDSNLSKFPMVRAAIYTIINKVKSVVANVGSADKLTTNFLFDIHSAT